MEIEHLRHERWTGVRIEQQFGLSPSTVSRVLRRMKLNRIRDLEPELPPSRYEHAAPGDMLHFDIKRLVRIHGHRAESTEIAATVSGASQERTASLLIWTHQYSWHRPHASLNQLPLSAESHRGQQPLDSP
ncbi:MAG: hypothetical protein ABI072_07650 [Edaphobacter sp.]